MNLLPNGFEWDMGQAGVVGLTMEPLCASHFPYQQVNGT